MTADNRMNVAGYTRAVTRWGICLCDFRTKQ